MFALLLRMFAMATPTLDIILPCYNPPPNWAEALTAAFKEIQVALGESTKISLILVNDGSRHGLDMQQIGGIQAQIPTFRYLAYETNQGKGHALRTGVLAATGSYQIYTDIDFPYTTASLVAVYQALTTGADIAAGVRDAGYYQHVPPLRRFISKFLRWMLRTFLRIKISDTQCGLKGFGPAGRAIFLRTGINRFLFDLEFIFLASGDDTTLLVPVDVQLRPGIEFSKARMGILIGESVNFASIFWKGLRNRIFRRR